MIDEEKTVFLQDVRCEKCNRLFFKSALYDGYLEIICPKCGLRHKVKAFNGCVEINSVNE